MKTWNSRANDLFLQALEQRSAEARQRFLEEACSGDAALRAEVEALLEASARAGSFLESAVPLPHLAATVEASSITEQPGSVIGAYKLLEQIGEGGFGLVFMAEQSQPVRRKVALKVLKPGMDMKQVVARFEAERQALALMDHPNIARVLDAGTTPSGRPYFVMELVKGMAITEFCDQHQLTLQQRLELFVDICRAVQHAHTKGIVHRDLKPSNVLVSLHDTRPVVKVIDFGIAKALGQELTDRTLFTGFAQMIGTPLYMSPEQAGQSGLDIDTRSDVYSLGVLLYELLTGTTPFSRERFRQAAYDEIRRIIREEEPPRPSTRLSESKEALPTISARRQMEPGKLTRLVRGELDWIVMKCLEKDRNRRYETASALAMDLQRHLENEPVLACPPSTWYRVCKFASRNRVGLAFATVVTLAMLVAIVALGVSRAWVASERDEKELAYRDKEKAFSREQLARKQREETLEEAATLALGQGLAFCEQGHVGRGLLWQARALEMLPTDTGMLQTCLRRNLHGWGTLLHPLRAILDYKDNEGDPEAVFSPDGKLVVVKENEHTARLLECATGRPVGAVLKHAHPIRALVFQPTGGAVLTISSQRLAGGRFESWLHLWKSTTGDALHPPVHFPDGVWDRMARFSPDGKWVGVGTKRAVRLLDLAAPHQGGRTLSLRELVGHLGFSPDGQLLVTASREPHSLDWEVRAWNPATGNPAGPPLTTRLDNFRKPVGASLSPDQKTLLAINRDRQGQPGGRAQLYNLTTGATVGPPLSRRVDHDILYSPDGKVVATLGGESEPTTAHLWDVGTGKLRGTLSHQSPVRGWAISPDGKRLLTWSDRMGRIWDTTTGRPLHPVLGHEEDITTGTFGPDNQVVLTGSRDHSARLWMVPAVSPRTVYQLWPHGVPLRFEGRVQSVGFNPTGDTFLVRTFQGLGRTPRVRLFGLAGTLPHRVFQYARSVHAFRPDGKAVLTGNAEWDDEFHPGEARGWNLVGGEALGPILVHPRCLKGGRFSPEGKHVATHVRGESAAGQTGMIHVWDVGRGKRLAGPLLHEQGAIGTNGLAFSADGKLLASVDINGWLKVWKTDSGELVKARELPSPGALDVVEAVAISPDGTTLAVGAGNAVHWLDLPALSLRTTLPHPGQVREVVFSPDGRLLLSGCGDNRARIWDLARNRLAVAPLEHEQGRCGIHTAAFSPDGQVVATASQDGTVRLWQTATGRPLAPPLAHPVGRFRALSFTPDGRFLLTGSGTVARRWEIVAPLRGDVRRLRLWVELRTGMELDAGGTVRWFDADTWLQRRHDLESLGGAPDG